MKQIDLVLEKLKMVQHNARARLLRELDVKFFLSKLNLLRRFQKICELEKLSYMSLNGGGVSNSYNNKAYTTEMFLGAKDEILVCRTSAESTPYGNVDEFKCYLYPSSLNQRELMVMSALLGRSSVFTKKGTPRKTRLNLVDVLKKGKINYLLSKKRKIERKAEDLCLKWKVELGLVQVDQRNQMEQMLFETV